MSQWDLLSSRFDTHKDPLEIDPSAADNILIAWPSLLQGIARVQPNGKGLKALDFGCGTGSFCKELEKHGYTVTGEDTSAGMIAIARKNLGNSISFQQGTAADVPSMNKAPFDLISSIMVLQFIEDVQTALSDLHNGLNNTGVLAFAVHNPAYVRANVGKGKKFTGFDDPQSPERGYIHLGDQAVPFFLRDERFYDEMLTAIGLKRVYSDRPPFTKDFLDKYPVNADTSEPEFLVLVYQR
jgi:SAM-dependent methyltransferase